ncbi:MAG: DUF1657 domain-containing protein [Dethiobacter sp.]|jgi:hypothetical protein|nr:DUF1657 domain-containing protein [Dethiobacter sp.]MBS3898747.1 DUF1657 domain-containing protein [Dethiobacter sp.]MBS3983581.1 DUF1657 domain-containing protein [Dethiobacter sp.]MCL4463936.1 DUF1657 domain-containing protein [Bacillota bacterium]MCL5993946.1 DUF1657 domain-containing protein [Bacillota bacterium]
MTVGSQLKNTLAGLKGAQATIRLYAQQTRHEQSQIAFQEGLIILSEVVASLAGRLQEIELAEPQYKSV